jgi:hypothetical protein
MLELSTCVICNFATAWADIKTLKVRTCYFVPVRIDTGINLNSRGLSISENEIPPFFSRDVEIETEMELLETPKSISKFPKIETLKFKRNYVKISSES